MSASMIVMQYACKFIELSRFVTEFVSPERLKIRRFEESFLYLQSVSWSTNPYLSRVM